MTREVRIPASVMRFVREIDEHVRRCDVRGPLGNFRCVAADVLDGWATRKEIAPLLRRGLLSVVEYEPDDSEKWGRDILWHCGDPQTCGTRWSVNPTERMVRALWPSRVKG